MGRLRGTAAVVTGAGSGIGLATVRRFAAEGASVVAVDVDVAAGEKAAAEAGGLFVAADVTEPEEVARARSRRRSPPAARSTSRSTTPVSPRLRTTRSSTPAWTSGAVSRKST